MTTKPEPRFNLAAAMAQRHGQPKPENKKYSLVDAMRRQVDTGSSGSMSDATPRASLIAGF